MEYLSLPELDNWLNGYYLAPQPELTPRAIATISKEGLFGEDTTQEPIMFFLSCVFRSHPQKLKSFLSDLTALPLLDQQVLVYAVWLSDTQESFEHLIELAQVCDAEIQEVIKNLARESPPKAINLPVDHPNILDILWSSFFATGEDKYVIRIISALSKVNSSDITDYAVLEAAKWSLRNNIQSHEKVYAICKNQLNKQQEDIALIIQEILDIGRS